MQQPKRYSCHRAIIPNDIAVSRSPPTVPGHAAALERRIGQSVDASLHARRFYSGPPGLFLRRGPKSLSLYLRGSALPRAAPLRGLCSRSYTGGFLITSRNDGFPRRPLPLPSRNPRFEILRWFRAPRIRPRKSISRNATTIPCAPCSPFIVDEILTRLRTLSASLCYIISVSCGSPKNYDGAGDLDREHSAERISLSTARYCYERSSPLLMDACRTKVGVKPCVTAKGRSRLLHGLFAKASASETRGRAYTSLFDTFFSPGESKHSFPRRLAETRDTRARARLD